MRIDKVSDEVCDRKMILRRDESWLNRRDENFGDWVGWPGTCAGVEVGAVAAPGTDVVRAGECGDRAGTSGEKRDAGRVRGDWGGGFA